MAYENPENLVCHIKIVPRYNDEFFIQHADDQINDGSHIDFESEEEIKNHEIAIEVIGDAIESYQGFRTVEVFWEKIYVDTDGEPDTDFSGSGLTQLYAEQRCERLKTIEITTPDPGMYHFVLRFRTKEGSSHYIDTHQYVYVVNHSDCGTGGA